MVSRFLPRLPRTPDRLPRHEEFVLPLLDHANAARDVRSTTEVEPASAVDGLVRLEVEVVYESSNDKVCDHVDHPQGERLGRVSSPSGPGRVVPGTHETTVTRRKDFGKVSTGGDLLVCQWKEYWWTLFVLVGWITYPLGPVSHSDPLSFTVNNSKETCRDRHVHVIKSSDTHPSHGRNVSPVKPGVSNPLNAFECVDLLVRW